MNIRTLRLSPLGTLASEAKARLVARETARVERPRHAFLVRVRDVAAHGHRAGVLARRRQDLTARVAPLADAAELLDTLAEDQAERDVEAADGEDKERGDERELGNVVREHGRTEQALDHAERAEAKIRPEDGEEGLEEDSGPAKLGQDAHDCLPDDEEPVEYRPERARGLVRHCAASAGLSAATRMRRGCHALDVVAVNDGAVDIVLARVNEVVDRADVGDHGHDSAREQEQERDDADRTDGIQREEEDCTAPV